MLRKLGRYVSFVLIVILMPISVEAEGAEQAGFYLGYNPSYLKIGGDFNGTDGPKIDPFFRVFNFVAGYRLTRAFFVQLGVEGLLSPLDSTNYSGMSTSTLKTVNYTAYPLIAKYNFMLDEPLQPFLKLGFVKSKLVFDGSSSEKQIISGTGYDLGGGLEYLPYKQGPDTKYFFTIALEFTRRSVEYEGRLFKNTANQFSTQLVNPFPKSSFKGDSNIIELNLRVYF